MTLGIIEKKPLDPGHITRSLDRSDLRTEIYLQLCEAHPKGETMEEISALTGYDKRSIRGALLGHGSRYRPEDALIAIGLATVKEERYHGQNVMVFTATSKGEDVLTLLRNYARQNDISEKLKNYVKQLEGIISKMQ